MLDLWKIKRGNVGSDFFFRRFTIVTLQLFVAISLLIIALVYFEVLSEREKNDHKVFTNIGEHARFINSNLDDLKRQVAVLQFESQSYFQKCNDKNIFLTPNLEDYIVQDSNFFSLDAMPDSLQKDRTNLSGLGNFKSRIKSEPEFREEVFQQWGLTTLFSATKLYHDEITWVYTISRNQFCYLHPFVPSYVARFDSTFLTSYDVYKMGTPEFNPNREMYMTPPYWDAGNKGLMISIGAPVYDNQEFRSIVAVDITMAYLTAYVRKLDEGEMMIVNEKNQVLAHPKIVLETDKAVHHLNEVLDEKTIQSLTDNAVTEIDGRRIFVKTMSTLPWKVIYIVPGTDLTISAIFDRYYFVLLALIASILFLIFFTYRHFIKPAQDIVFYIEGYGNNKIIKPDKVHSSWAKWFTLVGEAFEKKQEVIYHLDEEVKRKNLELIDGNKRLVQQREQLLKEHEAKDKIFTIVAHDLKSPIASLVGILFLLKRGSISDSELTRLLPSVELQAKRIKLMLENLLHWSICNLRAEKINLQIIDLRTVINDNIELLSTFSEVKKITINFPDQEVYRVETDINVVNLVLRNLIYNAIKFSPNNSEIEVCCERLLDRITVKVVDHGPGISPSMVDKIFVFGESGYSGTTSEKGTGLGLALCKEFLEKVNGTISFTTENNKGSTFYFSLPN